MMMKRFSFRVRELTTKHINEKIYYINEKNVNEVVKITKKKGLESLEDKYYYLVGVRHKVKRNEDWERYIRKLEEEEKRKLKCPYCGEMRENEEYCKLCGYAKPEEIKEEERSRTIPTRVRNEVWRRDNGRCVECGDKVNLEFDHIIPFSLGGSNTARNIQLLCEKCNRKKTDKIE